MNRKSIIIILASITIFIILYLLSSEEFLPWLRYRSITQWSNETNVYRSEISIAPDSNYRLFAHYSGNSQRVLIPWFGDSIDVLRHQDGIITDIPSKNIKGYDTSILTLSGDQILPHKVGKTRFIIYFKNGIDTLEVEVEKKQSVFAVHKTVAG
jgi:hypothetical protein